jgi:hypothetical protein
MLLLMAVSYSSNVFAQVKIGNNPTSLNPNAMLEIESSNKGLLLPRVALIAAYNPAPLTGFVNGMFVFNTVTNDSVIVGLYYSDGIKWVRVNGGATGNVQGNYWSLSGNPVNATDGNFLGTTNLSPLVIKTNNAERLRITENGWIGIGTPTPKAALQIKGQLIIDSLTIGNVVTDNFLVANPVDGKVKAVSASGFVSGVRKSLEVVANSGQNTFTTPAAITDSNKISLYRNGVLISFTVSGATSIVSEIPCITGDEIRIIQLL